MRNSAAEKLEIIRLVEQSSLPLRRTLAQIGIPRSTFYAWYERYLARGAGALEDGQPAPPRRVWNKLPDTVAEAVLELALDCCGRQGHRWGVVSCASAGGACESASVDRYSRPRGDGQPSPAETPAHRLERAERRRRDGRRAPRRQAA